MVVIPVSRSKKLKKLTSLISVLRSLKKSSAEKISPVNEKAAKFYEVINSIKGLSKEVIAARQKELQMIIQKSKDNFRLSTFSLMEYHFDENTHSNILEYIFDYKLMGLIGAEILSSFVRMTSQEFETISELIKKRNYKIEREYSCKNGRIDLFIKDDTNKFVVVIENKILSPVSSKDSEDDGSASINKTQLTNYYKSINKRFPSRTYKQAYILLSYSEIEDSDKYLPFHFTDYSNLIEILNSHSNSDDNILIEYRLLLNTLKKFNPEELLNLKRDSSSYLYSGKIKNQSLNSIEKLRMIIYGNN